VLNIPWGLLSIASQLKHSGHEVTVFNLYTFCWADVCEILKRTPANLFGLSCFTSNRRGTLYCADLLKSLHPDAAVIAGGPHATALPEKMLEYGKSIDLAVIGEGELTVQEIVSRLACGISLAGIAGTVFRRGGAIHHGARRPRITDLDSLVPVSRYFNEYIFITSRGCPWSCSFCASRSMWGTAVSAHSPAYILDALDAVVHTHGQRSIAIKDETFTADRSRVLELCRGIQARRLRFLWSCDTRADVLDDELLAAMRSAGCERISLGVESASRPVLDAMNKNLSPDAVRASVSMARKYGFQIRFYMIAGARNETKETFTESIRFVNEAKPDEVLFNPFTILPGTREYDIACRAGRLDDDTFFSADFCEYQPLRFETLDSDAQWISSWLVQHSGLQHVREYGVPECEAVARRLPGLHSVWFDLGAACYRQGDMERAREYFERAREQGYPRPELIHNYCACIAAYTGRLKEALSRLIAARESGFDRTVENNIERAQQWIAAGGPESAGPLELAAPHGFSVSRPFMQPTTPGAIQLEGKTFRPIQLSSH
jgi:radical SAM superfamily enzyme YgiQ (UPF0313 family)